MLLDNPPGSRPMLLDDPAETGAVGLPRPKSPHVAVIETGVTATTG